MSDKLWICPDGAKCRKPCHHSKPHIHSNCEPGYAYAFTEYARKCPSCIPYVTAPPNPKGEGNPSQVSKDAVVTLDDFTVCSKCGLKMGECKCPERRPDGTWDWDYNPSPVAPSQESKPDEKESAGYDEVEHDKLLDIEADIRNMDLRQIAEYIHAATEKARAEGFSDGEKKGAKKGVRKFKKALMKKLKEEENIDTGNTDYAIGWYESWNNINDIITKFK